MHNKIGVSLINTHARTHALQLLVPTLSPDDEKANLAEAANPPLPLSLAHANLLNTTSLSIHNTTHPQHFAPFFTEPPPHPSSINACRIVLSRPWRTRIRQPAIAGVFRSTQVSRERTR